MPTVFFLLCAAFCEDDDFVMRLKLLQPPGVIKTLKNVFVLHGAPSSAQYIRCAVTHSHSMTAGAAGSCQADQQLLRDLVCMDCAMHLASIGGTHHWQFLQGQEGQASCDTMCWLWL